MSLIDQTTPLPDALEQSEWKSNELRNEEFAKIYQTILGNIKESVATLDEVRGDQEPFMFPRQDLEDLMSKCHTSNIMGRTTAMPQRKLFELPGAEDVAYIYDWL